MAKKSKLVRVIGDAIKLAIVAAIIGGIIFFFFGDKLKKVQDVKDVKLEGLYSVDESEEKLQDPIKLRMNVPTPDGPGYYWRVYIKHLPKSQKEPEKDKLHFIADFKRKPNKSPRSDAGGTSHHYTPGDIALDLEIKKGTGKKTVYKKRYAHELKPIVVREAGEGISEDRKDKAYKDEEEKIIKYDLGPYLSIAAMTLMEKQGDLDDEYTPVIADACGHPEKKVSNAAINILRDLRPTDPDAIKRAKMRLEKRLPTIKEDEIRENAKKAQNFLEKRLERTKARTAKDSSKDADKDTDKDTVKDEGKGTSETDEKK